MQSVTKMVAALALAGGIALVPATGFAAQSAKPQKEAKHSSASHATAGTVKSIDANTMVITRSGKEAGDMTFQLNTSTHRSGTVEVGSVVSVRYQEEGTNRVATAITAQNSKQAAAAHNKPPAK
jgi:hypothetical protein